MMSSSINKAPMKLSYSISLKNTTDDERDRVVAGTYVQSRTESNKKGVVVKILEKKQSQEISNTGKSTRRTNQTISNVNKMVMVE